ncbi:DivIVA domain-containing protein [Corynebacterium meridianum]|uniref:DivIVA domain-containing protein n=1 Tax=Corynebacterium meridianum TaxID=2765363 RepID=A0A934M7U1_9CORY|nr:DivIVA domain-containing protein [Corynebacterium meridianum]MCK7678142.1 DivIVA domain-containing protein [Corynebacterium meridianum]
MLTWIIYICILLVLIVVFTVVFGVLFGRGETLPPFEEQVSDVRLHNDAAVREGRVDDIRFRTVLRGYRMDEVDRVVEAYEAKVADLRAQLDRVHATAD